MATAKKLPIDDVAKPGKTPADATARPIITTHAIMKDPMVTEDPTSVEEANNASEETTPEKQLPLPSAKKVIQPISDPGEPDAKVKNDSETPAKTETSAPEPSVDDVTDSAVVDAVVDQVADKKKEDKLNEEEQQRQELIDKLVDEKKYFLPITSHTARRNGRVSLLLLGALLPVIVGLGLAADAGLINLGFKVPFDFIKDKPVTTTNTQTPVTSAAAPVKTAVTYQSAVDKTTFEYPTTWKMDIISEQDKQQDKLVSLSPAETQSKTDGLTGGIYFDRNGKVSQPTSTSLSFIVVDVVYTPVPGITSKPIYVQELFVDTTKANGTHDFQEKIRLVDNTTVKKGDTVKLLPEPTVLASNGKDKISFYASFINTGTDTQKLSGPPTADMIQKIKQMPTYIQAKQILLSTRYPKQ